MPHDKVFSWAVYLSAVASLTMNTAHALADIAVSLGWSGVAPAVVISAISAFAGLTFLKHIRPME
jgi:hypothetical protein